MLMDKKYFIAILNQFREEFPKAFPLKSFVILKKGIDLDLHNNSTLNISRTKLRLFLRVYTLSPGYKKAHTIGAKRYNLNGEIAGEVTKEEFDTCSKIEDLKMSKKAKSKTSQ